SDEQCSPRRLQSIERLQQQSDAFFPNEAADEADDRRVAGPAVAGARAFTLLRVGTETLDVDTWRYRASGLRPSPGVEDVARRLAERDQPVGPAHRRSLDPVERRRVSLDDVLERREHERHTER